MLPLRGLILLFLLLTPSVQADEDILVADFEGSDYGKWKAEGDAFGTEPARGTLPGQMPVEGFLGKGLVNSFRRGDGSTGRLTSPAFRLERAHLRFLLGGGKDIEKTCMNLLVAGKIVRRATGGNDRPGGSERLDWQEWDVREFKGQLAVLEIVDQATGGWGHINVDHIVQTNKRLPGWVTNPRREVLANKRFLNFPVRTGAPARRVQILLGEQIVREFDIELAEDAPEFWTFLDLQPFQGKKLTIQVDRLPEESRLMTMLTSADEIRTTDRLYEEKARPQFHFTSRRGWLNDPNGLVYLDGEWHLFYQHNPYGWNWGNMHWGHAVSKDLFHWKELPIALYPRKHGDWAFSGSAIVDEQNTSGLGKEGKAPLIAAYTSTGRGECIAFSLDAGRTWAEIPENPVVRHAGRDPKLLWHAASKQWCMAVYDETDGKRWIAFYTSPDLRKWTYRSRIEGFFECPDLFALPVEGDAAEQLWVLYAADGKYVLGDFNGERFTPRSEKLQLWHGNFYAAQTYNNAPEGRRIQIGWGQGIAFPNMPFNQQMTVPVELTLRKTMEGVRLFALPVRELQSLRKPGGQWKNQSLVPGQRFEVDIKGDLLDLVVDLEAGKADTITLHLGETNLQWNVQKKTLSCRGQTLPLLAKGTSLRLRLLLDRGSLEVFANDGQAALSLALPPAKEARAVSLSAAGGTATLRKLDAFALTSVWTAGRSR